MSSVLSVETLSVEKIFARADQATIQRGQAYYRQARARVAQVERDQATLRVWGSRPTPYTVSVWLENGRAVLTCDCPVSGGDPDCVCKHQIAAALALRTYLTAHPPETWETVLARALKDGAPRKGASPAKSLLFFSLQKRWSTWGVYPYSLPLAQFAGIDTDDARAVAQAIQRHKLSPRAKLVRSRVDSRRFGNITEESRTAGQIAALTQQFSYYADQTLTYETLLPLLGGSLLYGGVEHDPLQRPLHLVPEPGVAALDLAQTAEGMRLRPTATLEGASMALESKTVEILCSEPLWILSGDTLFTLGETPPGFVGLLQAGEVLIPESDQDSFLDRYLLPLAERLPLRGDGVTREAIEAEPVPRLYLGEDQGEMQARLCFGYGDYELAYQRDLPPVSLQRRPDSLALVEIRRAPEREEQSWRALSGFGLKRGAEAGDFVLRAGTGPVDFLLHQIPRLAEAGFEVYGEEALTSARVNRNKPTISFNVSSGIDWFDVEAVVQFGDLEVSMKELRRAVRKRERYVQLADGSIGTIPAEWLDRYRYLFALSEETDEGLRVSAQQMTLLDQLLAEGDRVRTDAEFERRRQRLRDFSSIMPQPLPQGLTGTLRPYQKAGFDWLHFLHEYEFGGCLADDMGTGKTITTLSFLQSLRESGHAHSADLLVLPRSLLFNWERESARFTPSLRLLNYSDSSRAKENSEFDNYDVVLTTYGILLRDIERLRGYRFHYVVLDESQAIKNPVSQSAKAARLLQADHRLALTGTPVENSTLELWSLFAFLNPGLLGNLDYFRQEFASAIERRQDETAATFLRKMVHPFLLRRTKDQVATELPPRTERVLYTEMEPAQRKLYLQKRDYYRAQVLGLLDKDGMAGARMKILEGLLRLRQICCHPALVEPGFKSASGKFALLLETLETLQAEGHKALIFSQFVKMLTLIREALDARGIPYQYLDGKTRDRQARVDAFQSDTDVPFFLISLKAGGVGLNLTAADYVIHVDPWWNPAVERQATDRTHRIGQDKPVFVYKLIAHDSVEEKILQLQDRKRALVDQLISTESGLFKSLTPQDVAALFE